MPAPRNPYGRAGDGTYPPTQMLLRPVIVQGEADGEGDLDLLHMDNDPLNYFLTPPTPSGGGANGGDGEDDNDVDLDLDLDDMDFDAGIEDAKRPPPVVRSVSPSSLEGLSLPPPPRPPTPPRSSRSPPSEPDIDMAPTPEPPDARDDDGEQFLRLGPTGLGGRLPIGLPFSLRDFAASGAKKFRRGKEARTVLTRTAGHLTPPPPLSPSSSLPSLSGRGRSAHRPGPKPIGAGHARNRVRVLPSSRSSPHAWREPSPDVWSIEEEPEQERKGGGDREDGEVDGDATAAVSSGPTKPIDIPGAKHEKRVRFVLPNREM